MKDKKISHHEFARQAVQHKNLFLTRGIPFYPLPECLLVNAKQNAIVENQVIAFLPLS